METILAVVSVVYAAFCIWLMVRIVNRRERWARRTLAALVVGMPVLYVAGFGPAIWRTELNALCARHTAAIYWPLGRAPVRALALVRQPLVWYTGLAARPSDACGDSAIICLPVAADNRWSLAFRPVE